MPELAEFFQGLSRVAADHGRAYFGRTPRHLVKQEAMPLRPRGQTFFRGLAEGRRLLAWLRERIWPLEAAHDEESAYWSGLLGAAECLLGGTSTVQDIGIGPGAEGLLEAIAASGLRAFGGLCLMDEGVGLPAALRQQPQRALAEAERLGERFEQRGSGRLRALLNPRFILSCSDQLWRGVRELAESRRWPVHTHALEQEEETAAVRAAKAGRDEIEYFDHTGLLAADLRLAHGVWLRSDHADRLQGATVSVVHCPSSNLKLGSGVADLRLCARLGLPRGIGADGAPCSDSLDALQEVRLAALLQKWRHGPEAFSGLEALRLATSEGASALRLEREIGSVEIGKRADLLVLSRRGPELWASAAIDLHDLVAFAAGRACVRHLMVDGELLVEEGRLTRLDLEEIRRQASRHEARLLTRAKLSD